MRKTVNIAYLIRLALVVAAVAGAVHFLHWRQLGKQAQAFRHQADAAEERGDLDQAAAYLRRLLTLRPADTDSRARLALLMDQSARTEEDHYQTFLVMEQVLRDAPQRDDIRRREIAMILEHPRLQLFSEAKAHIDYLLAMHPTDAGLHDQNGRYLASRGEFEEAAREFARAVELAPDLIAAYGRGAALWRHRLSRTDKADELIQVMLARNGNSVAAHLMAASYWKEGGDTEKFAREVDEARRYAPDDPDVILAAADLSTTRADILTKRKEEAAGQKVIEEACAALRQAIDKRLGQVSAAGPPLEHDLSSHGRVVLANMFVTLASLEIRSQRLADAAQTSRQGIEMFPERADLRLQLIEALILQKQWPEAEKQLDELMAANFTPGIIDYHRGRIHVGRADWLAAIPLLERAADELAASGVMARRANLLLGTCYERIGLADRSYAAYRRALPADRLADEQLWLHTSMRIGSALAEMGRTRDAIRTYEGVARWSDSALVPLARLLIQDALRRPEDRRDWESIEDALHRAPADLARELVWADYHLARGKTAEARALLAKAVTTYPKAIEPVVAQAALEARQGQSKRAAELLAAAENQFGDQVEIRLVRASIISAGSPAERAKEFDRLAGGLDAFTLEQRGRLLRGLADIAQSTLGRESADRLWDRLAAELPDNLGVHLARFDRALQANDEARLEQAKAAVIRLDRAGGNLTKIVHVLHVIWKARVKGDRSGLAQAADLLDELERDKAGWSRAALAKALLLELQNKPYLALGLYRQAIDAGERDPEAIRRLVELYYEQRQYAEAENVLRQLPEDAESAEEFRQIAAEVSLHARDFARALQLAAKAVPPDSTDFRKQLWLSRVLVLAGQPDKAEAPLLRARDLAPGKPDVWVALVQYQVNRNQRTTAEQTIEDAKRRLDKADAPLALARCYEVVGRVDLARRLYEQALKERPDDLPVLKSAASLRLREGNLAEARKLLERILANRMRSDEDSRFARRLMIITLAADPDYETSRQALELANLLDSHGQPRPIAGNETADEIRTRTLALALQRDLTSKHEAIRLLEELGLRQPLSDEDQFLLAHLHNSVGDWMKARAVLATMLRTQGESSDRPTYIAYYALGLIRQPDTEEAERWVSMLERSQPGYLRTIELRARLLAALGEVTKARDLLVARAERADLPLVPVARLLEEIGAAPAAEALYARLASGSTRPEAALLLASYYGRQNRVAEALRLCELAWKSADPEAVGGTLVDVLYSAHDPRPEHIAQALTRVQEASSKKPGSAALLSMTAALLNLKQDYAAAIAAYRKALAQGQKDALTQNNLAFLLSASEGKHDEALAELARARTAFGPLTTLLDTEAQICLAKGDANRATRLLNEVITRDPTGPHYFHLAQAYLAANRRLDALLAWRQARRQKLQLSDLHPLEHAGYRKLEAELSRN